MILKIRDYKKVAETLGVTSINESQLALPPRTGSRDRLGRPLSQHKSKYVRRAPADLHTQARKCAQRSSQIAARKFRFDTRCNPSRAARRLPEPRPTSALRFAPCDNRRDQSKEEHIERAQPGIWPYSSVAFAGRPSACPFLEARGSKLGSSFRWRLRRQARMLPHQNVGNAFSRPAIPKRRHGSLLRFPGKHSRQLRAQLLPIAPHQHIGSH